MGGRKVTSRGRFIQQGRAPRSAAHRDWRESGDGQNAQTDASISSMKCSKSLICRAFAVRQAHHEAGKGGIHFSLETLVLRLCRRTGEALASGGRAVPVK